MVPLIYRNASRSQPLCGVVDLGSCQGPSDSHGSFHGDEANGSNVFRMPTYSTSEDVGSVLCISLG